MTNIQQYSEHYLRLLSDSDAASDEISAAIVLVFRQLYAAYPDPASAPAQAFEGLDPELGQQIMHWLASEHFIKVEENNVWLTLTGCEAIRRTCRDTPAYQSFFGDTSAPAPAAATELMLALLKTHFESGRAGGR